jgi:hypothetical protein
MKQEGFTDTGSFSDLTHGTLFIAAPGKHVKTGIQYRLLFFLRKVEKFRIHYMPR